MPTTLTIKDIPDDVYARLKTSAELNRRSINSEALVCLETVLALGRFIAGERLRRARTVRGQLNAAFDTDAIDALKRKDRA